MAYVLSSGTMTIDNRYTTDIIVTNSGRLNIISGGNLQYDSQTGAYVRSGGRLHISNGGLMSKGVAVSDGIIHISSGGTLLKLWAVSQGGLVYVSNGGLMSSGYVSSGGQVHVNSGGTAVDVVCLSSGIIAVNSGGLALHPIVARKGWPGLQRISRRHRNSRGIRQHAGVCQRQRSAIRMRPECAVRRQGQRHSVYIRANHCLLRRHDPGNGLPRFLRQNH